MPQAFRRWIFCSIAVLLLPASAATQPADTASAQGQAYADLVAMLKTFETLAEQAAPYLPDGGKTLWYDWEQLPPALATRRDSLVAAHSRRLSAIIAEHGFPTEDTLMPHSAAYILWRHSVDAPTQQHLLPTVIDAQMADMEAPYRYVMKAELTDRVALRTTRSQIYGTHVCQVNGTLRYFPIQNREVAARYRAQYGMSTLEDYLNGIGQACPCSDRRPCPAWARRDEQAPER